MIEASASIARRFLVLRHLLAPPRGLPADPASVLAVVDRLGSLQFDPLEVAGRNHDLVLLARVAGYRRAWTDALLYDRRVLFEAYNKGLSILPTSELPYHRITWDRARAAHTGGAFDEHAPLVEELLDRIRRDGALSSTDLEPRAAIDWYWRPTNQIRALLEALAEARVIAITRREGNRRVYDLAERLFPPEILATRPPEREQRRHRLLSRYRAHGLLGTGGQAELWFGVHPDGASGRAGLRDDLVESGDLVPIRVEGVRGDRFIVATDAHFLEAATAEVAGGVPPGGRPPGVALLAPLDPLVWDRDLLRALFGFDYVWEVYVPERKRRWGYYVLPILFGDRLVGRIEPRIDRGAGALRVLDLWWEEGFEPLAEAGFVDGLAEALRAHRDFAGLQRVVLPRTVRHRALAGALRQFLR
ncbi:MAG: YcaQ family DNA glycosylase [Chloroflexi bacterium]|nr:YcaQ family DNA glycosylase [Chloroflexota bacterium]